MIVTWDGGNDADELKRLYNLLKRGLDQLLETSSSSRHTSTTKRMPFS